MHNPISVESTRLTVEDDPLALWASDTDPAPYSLAGSATAIVRFSNSLVNVRFEPLYEGGRYSVTPGLSTLCGAGSVPVRDQERVVVQDGHKPGRVPSRAGVRVASLV